GKRSARGPPPRRHGGGGAGAGAPAVGEAVDHANGGLGTGADLVAPATAHGVPGVQLRLRVAPVVLPLLVDVAPRGEGARPRTGDDDAAHLVVGGQPHDAVVQLRAELVVHGVELIWAVQGEDADAVHLLHEDTGVHHASSWHSATGHDARSRFAGGEV